MNNLGVRAVTPHLPIVGIGASAGGVEALEAFFRAVPAENGMAFVVVTHLPPYRDSLLAEILGRATQMPVVNAPTTSRSKCSMSTFSHRARS